MSEAHIAKSRERHSARDLARKHTRAAIAYLVSVIKDKNALNSDRIKAAQDILNRGWGRPPEDMTFRVAEDSGPLRVRWMDDRDRDDDF